MYLLIKESAAKNRMSVEHKMSATMIKFFCGLLKRIQYFFRPFSLRNLSDDLQDEQIIAST